MKDIILEYINSVNYQPSTFEDLALALEVEVGDYEKLSKELEELINNYEVFLNKKKDRFLSPRQANLYKGIINVRQDFSFGFVKSDLPYDVHISKGFLCGAFNGDEVLFSLDGTDKFGRSDEGIVQKILKRKTEYIVGKVYKHNNLFYLEHNEKGFPEYIRLKDTNHIKVDKIVRAKITKYDRFSCCADVIDIIGDASDIGMDITSVAASFNLRMEFPENVLNEVKSLETDLEAEKKRRVDYTDKLIFTIDGKDAKDLDDAVSIEVLENGNYELGVYIADVSYYVNEDSELDKEAFLRGTSVYLADRVIPMLPVRLSNDLCSLNPNEEKLVIACIMEINRNGEVLNSSITEGVIKTVKRLNYEDCNKVLEEGIKAVPDYEEVYNSLVKMSELAEILFERKHNLGALDFDIPESKVVIDDNGKTIDIVPRERGISEHIIEQFMICANETVASFIENMDLPFIYRVHDKPDKIKFHLFKGIASSLGYSVRSLKPLELQRLLENVDDKHGYIKTLVLRLMAKAVYSEENIGHFGLASLSYTHFTSPIRRYPDLIVHRLLRKYLFNHDIKANEFGDLINKIAYIAKHSSEQERNASDCEMKVLDMKKAEYMADFIGEKFKGTVSSVTKFGVFVTLENSVDGLVHISNMDGDFYQYDSHNNCYFGRRTRRSIKLGDDVSVQLIKSDKKTSEIDFKLVYNNSNRKPIVSKGDKYNGKGYKKSKKSRRKK